MGTLTRKIELFLRGEFWLHIATMFFILTVFQRFIHIKAFWLLFITLIIALGWEILWKIVRGNKIDPLDILATTIGGVLSIILIH